jgi:NDP-sugar pyrophosphorylase family protein
MRGFVLAAGFGTRLQPLTDHLPKALVPAGGKPLLSRSLDLLHNSGICHIGVNSHYLHDQLCAFRESSGESFELFHEEGKIRGTGGALDFARDFLGGDDTFVIVNVDIVTTIDLALLGRRFDESGFLFALVCTPPEGRGTILYDATTKTYLGTLAGAATGASGTPADFIGITFYKKEFLDLVNGNDFSILPVWERAAERGFPGGVLPVDDYWCDAGTPQLLAGLHFDIIDGRAGLDIPAHLCIDPKRAQCRPATMTGGLPQEIGPHAWIETDTLPAGCRIKQSVILDTLHLRTNEHYSRKIATSWGLLTF